MLSEIIVSLIVVAVGGPQSGLLVDLTNVAPRNRVREPATASSSGGSVGGSAGLSQHKSSIEMNVLSVELAHTPQKCLVFQVEVRNTGEEQLEFPVDPSLADFEPGNAAIAYGYTAAHITLFIDLKQQGSLFLPEVSLYGSEGVGGSLKELGPGESIRIRASTPVKAADSESGRRISAPSSIKAVLLMQRDLVSQENGVLHEDSRQILPQVTSLNAVPFPPDP
jgi:hypothetical protein